MGVKHEEWREPEVGVTTDDKASHEAEDWVKLILESSVMILQPWQSFQWARRPLKKKASTDVTYRFGGGRDVLDDHLAFGTQVLFTQWRFAFLVQVHVLLHTHTDGTEKF